MFASISKEKKLYYLPVVICVLCVVLLAFLPTGYEDAVIFTEADHCTARVIACDNQAIIDTGLVRSGEQICTIRLLDGSFKGQVTSGVNMLNGSLEQDKVFQEGDTALVLVNQKDGKILSVSMIDHYRLGGELLLAGLFTVLLLAFAGRTGLRAVLSFVLTVLMIWKILIPFYLRGANPVWIGLGVTLLMTVLIIAPVYGFSRRASCATAGARLGIAVTCVLGILFTDLFRIHGAVMSCSESLLYSGYQDLNLT